MTKYLRRRSDGMKFGYDPNMALVEGMEEIDEEPGEEGLSKDDGEGQTDAEKLVHDKQLRSDTFQGYPHKGFAPDQDAPYGAFPPERDEDGNPVDETNPKVLKKQRKEAREKAESEAGEFAKIYRENEDEEKAEKEEPAEDAAEATDMSYNPKGRRKHQNQSS